MTLSGALLVVFMVLALAMLMETHTGIEVFMAIVTTAEA
jgi:hypothetical protein